MCAGVTCACDYVCTCVCVSVCGYAVGINYRLSSDYRSYTLTWCVCVYVSMCVCVCVFSNFCLGDTVVLPAPDPYSGRVDVLSPLE